MKAIILLLALWAGQAHARVHLQVHGLSDHGGTYAYNERNWGAGLRLDLDPNWSVQAGYYHNSYRKHTLYGVVNWTPLWSRFGAFVGIGTGYDLKYPVLGGLMYREQWDVFSYTLRYVPRTAHDTSEVVALELGWRIK